MKTNKSNYRSCFLIIVLFITAINLSAQETNTNSRLNIKLGYSKYSNTDFIFYSTKHENDGKDLNEVGNIRLSSNFRINKFIDAGLYFGFSIYKTYIPQNFDSLGRPGTLSFESANSIMFGLNTNIHILPFFIKKENFRFDLYCSLQYSNIHLFEPEGGINTKRNYQEYGIYGGLAFYPFRHLGFYTEYGYAKYANLRYGLSFKF